MKGFASSDEHDPRVIVWDVDGTLWLPEMYQLRGGSPFRANEDGDVFDCRGEHVYLLSDAIAVLERIHNEFPHAFVAIASTCDEPEWAKELLKVVKAGSKPLGSFFREDLIEIYYARDKSVHLSAIARKAGCELHEMLFFDNQQNNIDVGDRIRVTSILTPEGVSHKIFDDSISKHRKKIKEMKKGK